jgi:undecaprenyl-diphosphatase
MSVDEQLFLQLNNFMSGPFSTLFFSCATKLGNGWVLAAIIVPGLYFFNRDAFKRQLLPLAITVALGGLMVAGIKVAVARPRPPAVFAEKSISIHLPAGEPSDYSFPSGHTQTAFSAAVYLSMMFPSFSPVFILLATLVGFSRIALGVHFPSDVLAGAIFGAAIGIAGFKINILRLTKR